MVWVLVVVFARGVAVGAESDAKAAGWKAVGVEEVRKQLSGWLDEQKVDEKGRGAVLAAWPADEKELAGPELLVRLAKSFAMVDWRAKGLVDLCSRPKSTVVVPEQAWLGDKASSAWMAKNLRLYYGRWLVHQSLYDEAKEQLAGLEPGDVVDPASLLFYQAVVYRSLVEQEACMKALSRLLEGTSESPKRYAAVARLMREDLKSLKPDSLGHIAVRMGDIQRRLELGRAGEKVRKVEDGVIASLDKLIDNMEKQQQQQSQAAAGSGSMQPNSPAQDSRIMGGRGPGKVTKKTLKDGGNWGNLPPKQREEAMQQIGRDFPAHYRDVVEQYFRRLAGEGSE